MPPTYYIVCVTKYLEQKEAHKRIRFVGTNMTAGASECTRTWPVGEVIRAIRRGDNFCCTDPRGDIVRVIVATHGEYEYLRTETDGMEPENLLALPEC